MATFTTTIFPEANTQDVCLIQSTVGVANLVINGNLASSGSVSFTSRGYARQLSFTSANNLSSSTFTIVGTQNGVSITETLSGPNANSVYSTLIYDTIVNISVNAAIAGVSVGTGYSGFFNLITITPTITNNYGRDYTLSLGATVGSNQISTTVYSTLANITNNSSTFLNNIANNVGTLFQVKASSATNLYILPVSPITTVPLVNQILVQLTGSAATIANSVTMIVGQ